MEEQVYIDLPEKRVRPGSRLQGEVFWALEKAPKRIRIRFGWFTEGRGTVDNEIVAEATVEHPASAGQHRFAFEVPEEPCSFEGQLITLSWLVEVIVGNDDRVVREAIEVVAGDDVVRLPKIEDARARKSLSFQRDR